MVMPNQMDMMMGLMDQVKRMRQPDERGGKPGRELYGPWALTGFTRKDVQAPSGSSGDGQRGAGIQAYAQQPAGAEYDQQIGAIDEEITNLRRQLAMVQTQLAQAVQNQDQYRAAGLRETITALKEQIAALQQDRDRIENEAKEAGASADSGTRGRMGATSYPGSYMEQPMEGWRRAIERRGHISTAPIQYVGGGGGGGGNPFGWMGSSGGGGGNVDFSGRFTKPKR